MLKLLESKNVVIKRRHTDVHPSVKIKPDAVLRNKIVSYFSEKQYNRDSTSNFLTFLKSIDDDKDLKGKGKGYHHRNSNLFRKLRVGSVPHIGLSDVGKRILKIISNE